MIRSYHVVTKTVTIANPSQLILSYEEFLQLSKSSSISSDELKAKEQGILSQIKKSTSKKFNNILIPEIKMSKIEDHVNNLYADGIDLEEESVRYPFDRSIRRSRRALSPPKISPVMHKPSSFEIYDSHLLDQRLKMVPHAFVLYAIFDKKEDMEKNNERK